MLQLLLILLPIVFFMGWLFGKQRRKSADEKTEHPLIPYDYFVGLNYIINEQPDKAVDVFVKMLEVNTDTVETHLALGNLFRRRGEVDRAIRIHQNLIARPHLDKKQRILALLELAQDYLRAGVLDRAERLFLELVKMNEEIIPSYGYLINIYQQQKDWQQAIVNAKKLEEVGGGDMHVPIAHYYCELALQALAHNQTEQMHEYIKNSLKYDKNCARANIILGNALVTAGQFKQAIRVFKQVQEQDSEYVSEIISQLTKCYYDTGREKEFIRYLKTQIETNPRIYFILAMTDYLCAKDSEAAAIEYLTGKLYHCLSLRGLGRLLELYMHSADKPAQNKLLLLKEFVEKLAENRPVYRCIHCGFSGKQLYWQCPSCRRWNSVKPIHGLEGD